MVEFDVAVSAEGKKASGVRGQIRVLEFSSAGAKRSSETDNATVSRIKFKIPLRLSHAARDFRPWQSSHLRFHNSQCKKRPAIGIRRKSERLLFCVVIPFARVVYVCIVSSAPGQIVGIVCVSGVVENAGEM
jgi:hypothetical protein